jgi:hypothetical protein
MPALSACRLLPESTEGSIHTDKEGPVVKMNTHCHLVPILLTLFLYAFMSTYLDTEISSPAAIHRHYLIDSFYKHT